MADIFKFQLDINEDDIMEDVKTYLKYFNAQAGQNAADLLTENARIQIEKFYNNYPNPIEYERTENLKKHSYRRYYRNKGNGTVEGGVIISPELMHEYYQSIHDKETGQLIPFDSDRRPIVVHNSWFEGWHGYEGQVPDYKMNPTPLDLLITYRNSEEFEFEVFADINQSINSKYSSQFNYHYNF